MRVLPFSVALMGMLIQQASAVTWYFLPWYTTNTSAQLQLFSVALNLRQAGIYYVWPGLQDSPLTGVCQEVLDGRSGEWWIGPGWCCRSASHVPNQNVVDISMTRDVDDVNWTSNLKMGSAFVSNSFPLACKNFNQAILAIALYNESWDFGELVFNEVIMDVNITETAWCTDAPENYDSATNYTLKGVKAYVLGSSTACTISQVVMWGPA